MPKRIIVIAGNIGAGKTSLAERLGARLGWVTAYESVSDNPYLPDFYADMRQWSFHLQVFFLGHRSQQFLQMAQMPQSVIFDRSIYEDAEIFANNLYQQGALSIRDFETYQNLYRILTEFLPPPDLVIYLRASVETLVKRISMRGRDFEKSIAPEYLTQLNTLYENWIKAFTLCPVLTVPADDLDYVAHPPHLELIVKKVQDKLTGKDEVIFAPEEVAALNQDPPIAVQQ